ncbi:hypothetical protein [Vibrio alginolyticus]|uniref:hypothetical protein n=1 Tax=Vibrio alginolyticus TaxID=663 RepID=UPI001BD37575|nr:hypothetical protein [Vibrio alginolyticus]MBS9903210.1 hypothetical protein [Vibrio alginolyticus]
MDDESKSAFSEYWEAYGGLKALFSSYYLWLAVVITFALFPAWTDVKAKWWADILSIMPNMLGFTLGGYAMWVAIGDDKFKQAISGREDDEDQEPSPFMVTNATFVHFLLLQVSAIIFALFGKTYDKIVIFTETQEILAIAYSGFSYFIFIYAILTAIAAVFALLKVSSWFDMFQTSQRKK